MYITPIEFATPEYDEAVQLRSLVLREPLGLSYDIETLSREYADLHIVAYNERNEIVGVLLLSPLDTAIMKMRQVAVHPTCQGKGIGSALVAYSERYAKLQGYTRLYLHAREIAVSFYTRLGYQPIGAPFSEIGIPHIALEKAVQ